MYDFNNFYERKNICEYNSILWHLYEIWNILVYGKHDFPLSFSQKFYRFFPKCSKLVWHNLHIYICTYLHIFKTTLNVTHLFKKNINMDQTRQKVKRPTELIYFWTSGALLTWYYLFWGSRWFLSNEYAKGTNLNICQVLSTCLTLLKHPPVIVIVYHIYFPFVDIYIFFSNIFWLFTKPLVSVFGNITWFWIKIEPYMAKFDFR